MYCWSHRFLLNLDAIAAILFFLFYSPREARCTTPRWPANRVPWENNSFLLFFFLHLSLFYTYSSFALPYRSNRSYASHSTTRFMYAKERAVGVVEVHRSSKLRSTPKAITTTPHHHQRQKQQHSAPSVMIEIDGHGTVAPSVRSSMCQPQQAVNLPRRTLRIDVERKRRSRSTAFVYGGDVKWWER